MADQSIHSGKATLIHIAYKSGSGSACARYLLNGIFTQAMYEQMTDKLDDGMNLVPHQMGLHNPAEDIISEYGYDDDHVYGDHGWCFLRELHWSDGGDFKSFQDRLTELTLDEADALKETKQSKLFRTGLSTTDFVKLAIEAQDPVSEDERLMML